MAGRERSAIYQGLAPGSYRFRVAAAGSDGVFREDERAFEFSIAPFFYQRSSVQIAAIALLLGLVGFLVWFRSRRLLRRQFELEHVVAVKTRELSEANEQLRLTARLDPLTRVFNRRGVLETAEREIRRCRREGQPLAVVMADVDHFKAVNDNYGHEVGDAVLRRFATVMSSCVRDHDIVGRWGGEEFILVLPSTDEAGAMNAAENVRRAIESVDFVASGIQLKLTVTLGVCEISPSGSLTDAVRAADGALYRGKSEGRNRSVSASGLTPRLDG